MKKNAPSRSTVSVGLSEPVRRTKRAEDPQQERAVVLEESPKRIRVFFAGHKIADSTRAKLLHETGHLPVYYLPAEDTVSEFLRPSEHTSRCDLKGDARYWSVVAAERVAENAVWSYPEPPSGCPDIRGLMAFQWDKMDAWYEEDEEVFVHARDPYKRIDILESSRHIKVAVDGVTVADSNRPMMLFETGLPVRYYLPKIDVRMELLEPTETQTACPYKGRTSRYWAIRVNGASHQDLVWCYDYPTQEAAKIAGRVCFYDERVELYVDGELQQKPQTPWS